MKNIKNFIIFLGLFLTTIAKADFTYSGASLVSLDWDQTVSGTAPTATLSFNYVSTGSNLLSPTLSGTDAAKFKISTDRCSGLTAKTCTVTLTLNRISTAGTYTAVLNLSNSAPASIQLSTVVKVAASSGGSSSTEAIAFSPTSLSSFLFDTYTSQNVSLTLTNNGTNPIKLGALSWSTPSSYLIITMDRCSNANLTTSSSSKSCSITVQVKKPLSTVNSNLTISGGTSASASLAFSLTGPASCTFNGQTYLDGASINGYTSATVPYGQLCSSVAVKGVCSNGTISPTVNSATCTVQPALRCTISGKTYADGASISGYTSATVPYGQTCSSVAATGVCTNGSVSNGVVSTTCSVTTLDCTYNGQTVPHGSSVQAYQSSTVPFGQTCSAETRTCTNGNLSGSFTNTSCSVSAPLSCNYNGQTIASGQTVLGYSQSTVPYGQTCSSYTMTGICQNGTITNQPTFSSCTMTQPLDCSLNGQTIISGQKITMFENSSVPYGTLCKQEQRLCTNGSLSGTFTNASCTVQPGATCSFNGQTIASGQSVSAYATSSVAFGQTCASEQRLCTNGTLSGSNTFSSCSVDQALSCTFNGQTFPHGASIPGFSSNSVPFGTLCSTVATSGICQNGSITNQPTFSSCTVQSANNCTFNGQSVLHGDSVQAYATSSVAFGNTCSSEQRTCNNGTLSGSNTFSACTVSQPLDCTFNGQTVLHGASVSAYDSASVAFGNSCVSEQRTCNNGVLSGSKTIASCVVDQPLNCTYNQQIIPHGQSASGFTQSSAPSGSSCSIYATTSLCDNGNLVNPPTSPTCYVAFPEWISPTNPNLAICQGSTSLPSTLVCHKDSVSGDVIPNTECSQAIAPANTVFQSPAGNVVDTITNGTETNQCAIGSSTKTFVSRSCDSGFFDNGTSCTASTFTATYSTYSPDPATIQPCAGNVQSTRTILSCKRDVDNVSVATSFCTDPNPTITTASPVGQFSQAITNGTNIYQCASGATVQTFLKRTCSTDYYSTTTDSTGSCALRSLMFLSPQFGDLQVLTYGYMAAPNLGITNGDPELTGDIGAAGFVNDKNFSFYYNRGVLGTVNDRYLLYVGVYWSSNVPQVISLDRVNKTSRVLTSFTYASALFKATTNDASILDTNFKVSEALNGYVYFKVSTSSGGELWRTDGTQAGTSLVKQFTSLIPGTEIIVFGNKLYFFAADSSNGLELWTSDGTTNGTTLVADLNPGTGSALGTASMTRTSGGMAILNNKIFFRATNGTTGGIYSYNYLTNTIDLFMAETGSTGNLSLVFSDKNSDYSVNKRYYDSTKMYIKGANGQLYITDGTVANTTTILNGSEQFTFHTPIGFTSNRFYFNCFNQFQISYTICSVDPSNVVRNFYNQWDDIIDLEFPGSSPGYVYNKNNPIETRSQSVTTSSGSTTAFVGDTIYFMTDNQSSPSLSMGNLFKVTNDQLYKVKEITTLNFGAKGNTSTLASGMYYAYGYQNKVYFTTETSTGRELVISNGTPSGTGVLEINNTVYNSTQISADVRNIIGYNGKIYFTANRPLTPNSRNISPSPLTNYFYMPMALDPMNGTLTELSSRTATGTGSPNTQQYINDFFKF